MSVLKFVRSGVFVLALAAACGTTSAAVYDDTDTDAFEGAANPILEITSVEVTNDTSNLTFKVNLAGDPTTTNWGKYLIGIDSVAGGNTTGNGWGRPISMSSGMDYFIGSWLDFGSGWELYHDVNGGWVREHATADANNPLTPVGVSSNALTFTMPLSYLNLGEGSTFAFDVYTAGGGGGDSANDASANPSQSVNAWNAPYNSGANVTSYTVTGVPEPTSMALIGVGGLALLRRRR